MIKTITYIDKVANPQAVQNNGNNYVKLTLKEPPPTPDLNQTLSLSQITSPRQIISSEESQNFLRAVTNYSNDIPN